MEDRGAELLATAILFAILSWIAIGLRVYVRARMIKSMGIDDWIMLFAQVCDLRHAFLLLTEADHLLDLLGMPDGYRLLRNGPPHVRCA